VILILKYQHNGSSFYISRNDGNGKNEPAAGVPRRLNRDGENRSWEQDQDGGLLHGCPGTRMRIVHTCFTIETIFFKRDE